MTTENSQAARELNAMADEFNAFNNIDRDPAVERTLRVVIGRLRAKAAELEGRRDG